MTSPQKRKGDTFERAMRDLLAAHDVPTERIPAGATVDIGDIWTPGAAVQCKNRGRLELGVWMTETLAQQNRAGKPRSWLAVKRRGVADPRLQFAVCTTAQMAEVEAVLTSSGDAREIELIRAEVAWLRVENARLQELLNRR